MRKNLLGISLVLAGLVSSYTTSRLLAYYRLVPDDPGCIQVIQIGFGWCDSFYCLNSTQRNVLVNGNPQSAMVCLDGNGNPTFICFPNAFVWNEGDPVLLKIPVGPDAWDTYGGHLTSWRDAADVWHVGFCVTLIRSPIGDP